MNRRDLSDAAVSRLETLVSEYENAALALVDMMLPGTPVKGVVDNMRAMAGLLHRMADTLESDEGQ